MKNRRPRVFFYAYAFQFLVLGCGASTVEKTPQTEFASEEKPQKELMTPEEAWKMRQLAGEREREQSGIFADVRQPGTNLYWLRCPVGQRWNGKKCKGHRRAFQQMRAADLCPRAFRLPRVEEFMMLLGDCDHMSGRSESGMCRSCYNSRNCNSMFGDDRGWYWSNEGVLHSSGNTGTWSVSFDYGYVHFVYGGAEKRMYVRCVRSEAGNKKATVESL